MWSARCSRPARTNWRPGHDPRPGGRHEGPEPGWTATISSPILDSPITRPITRLDGPGGGFPVVRPEALPDGIAARQVGESDIAAFGGYLHAVLLGPAWATIVVHAAGQPVELALRWTPAGPAISPCWALAWDVRVGR